MREFVNGKRWALLVPFVLVVAAVFAGPVAAAEIVGEEGDTVIEEGEVIEDDYVFAGQSLTVNGTIEGDLVAAGETITIGETGVVEGDLLSGAQSIIIEGEVNDDTYVGGYLIQLGEGASLGDELIVGGFSLEAADGSSVGGDVLFGGFQALLGGAVDGDVRAGANSVEIDGAVGGDAKLDVGDAGEEAGFNFAQYNPNMPPVADVPAGLTVDEDASIEGDLSYTSGTAGDVASGAVAGSVDFNQSTVEEPEFEFRPGRPGTAVAFFAGQFVLKMVRRFLTLILVGLLVVWLASKLLKDTVDTFKSRPWDSLGLGALGYAVTLFALALVPGLLIVLAIVLGVVSLGGLTPAVIGFGSLGWGALLVGFLTAVSWLAKIILGFWLGDLIWKGVQPEGTSMVPPVIIGAALAALLTSIPVLGGLLRLAVGLFGLGALILTLRARARGDADVAPAAV